MSNYLPRRKVDEGSFGVVHEAEDKESGEIFAIKRVKFERSKEGFPLSSLWEIKALLLCDHPNILKLREVVFGSTNDKVYLVLEYI